MKPGDSMPHSQRLSNNPYPKPNQYNSSYNNNNNNNNNNNTVFHHDAAHGSQPRIASWARAPGVCRPTNMKKFSLWILGDL